MKKELTIPNSGFCKRMFKQVATTTGVLFFLFAIASFFIFNVLISLTVLVIYLVFIVSGFTQAINYIESIIFLDEEVVFNQISYNKKVSSKKVSYKSLKIAEFSNPIGITSLFGNGFSIYMMEKKTITQYNIDGWDDPIYLKRLMEELKEKQK